MAKKPFLQVQQTHIDDLSVSFAAHNVPLTLEELEGFLTAVACLPTYVKPTRWFSTFGMDKLTFADDKTREHFYEKIVSYFEIISAEVTLKKYKPSFIKASPALEFSEIKSQAYFWAKGFMRGLELEVDLIKKLFNIELIPILFPVVSLYVDTSNEDVQVILKDENRVQEWDEIQTLSVNMIEQIIPKFQANLFERSGTFQSQTVH